MVKQLLVVLLLFFALTWQATAQEDVLTPPPDFDSWDAVLEAARGTTVNWAMWGGSEDINAFVDTFYGDVLAEEYGITLNRIPLADTVDAVNLVLSELEAGRTDADGSLDMIWINGENFFTLRQADALYGPWALSIPNSALVNWENPAVAFDFGYPVEGYESPWSSAQLQLIYDSAQISADDLPRNFDELTAWIAANPGRFTYVAPGAGGFQGTRFVKQVFYHISGGYEAWVGDWDADLYAETAPQVWELLNAWEPNLWRGGETYPSTESELNQLFANGEVDFGMTQATAGASPLIAAGLLPETAKAFTFDAYMIGDYNYVAIPINAPNTAGALVLADVLLRPDRQAGHVLPETGFGLGYAIDINRVEDAEQRALLEAAFANLGSGAADPAALAAAFAPDMAPESQAIVEADWEINVLQR